MPFSLFKLNTCIFQAQTLVTGRFGLDEFHYICFVYFRGNYTDVYSKYGLNRDVLDTDFNPTRMTTPDVFSGVS
jgi:hypothetical protein